MVGALEEAAVAAGGAFREAKAKSTRKRAKITAGVKAKVKSLVGKGLTGSAVARKLGISVASVQNIKKKLGLVREAS
jgi:DNA invertase Pin-like site-specific DNA recombinase